MVHDVEAARARAEASFKKPAAAEGGDTADARPLPAVPI